MLAYNHEVLFDPDDIPGTSLDVIKVLCADALPMSLDTMHKKQYLNNQGREVALYTDLGYARTVPGQLWCFEVKGVAWFYWYSGSATLYTVPSDQFTEALQRYWVLHIIVPVYLAVEEVYDFLHAGAVLVEGRPVLFMAESLGGKSTMTDFFLRQGHPLISDDKVAFVIEGPDVIAMPSHPHHRPYRKTEDLGTFVENMAASPRPIHAIYVLDRAPEDADVEIAALRGTEKFIALRYGSEVNMAFLKTQRFSKLGAVAERAGVYRVTVPWSLGRLKEVYDAICIHTVLSCAHPLDNE